MRIQTTYNHQTRAISTVVGIYSHARAFGETSEAMNAKLRGLMQSLAKCPERVRAHVRGYCEALNAELYRSELVFGGMVDGKFYSTHRDRADYYERNGISPADFADNGKVKSRGHYWAHNLKPYFIGS